MSLPTCTVMGMVSLPMPAALAVSRTTLLTIADGGGAIKRTDARTGNSVGSDLPSVTPGCSRTVAVATNTTLFAGCAATGALSAVNLTSGA